MQLIFVDTEDANPAPIGWTLRDFAGSKTPGGSARVPRRPVNPAGCGRVAIACAGRIETGIVSGHGVHHSAAHGLDPARGRAGPAGLGGDPCSDPRAPGAPPRRGGAPPRRRLALPCGAPCHLARGGGSRSLPRRASPRARPSRRRPDPCEPEPARLAAHGAARGLARARARSGVHRPGRSGASAATRQSQVGRSIPSASPAAGLTSES